jgi:predicted nucleic acid-binding protein
MASKLQHAKLLSKLKENEAKIKVSIITKIEVLGYHQLKQVQKKFLENFFNAITVLPLNDQVVNFAIEIRQKKPVSLADSLIAATALAQDLELLTENIKDYRSIQDLRLLSAIEYLES